MARKYTKISTGAFYDYSIGSGIVLSDFDPTGATDVTSADIICDTSGDISVTCVPTYIDLGEDVNNCPPGMMELQTIDGWETRLSFTALNLTPETIRLSLGAADVKGAQVTPRQTLVASDFSDVWLVGNLMGDLEQTDDRYFAVHLLNALSSSGMSLTTTDKGKGKLQIELSGHVSLSNPDVVPMEFYISD